MDIPNSHQDATSFSDIATESYLEKYRPRPRKMGQPRTQREELIQQFLDRLNPEQLADNRPPFTFARLTRMFKGISDSRLYQLFNECSAEGVRSFGAMLTYKLKHL